MTIEELRAENMRRLGEMEARGYQIDPLILLKERLDVVTAWAVPSDNVADMEQEWEERIEQILDAAPPPEPQKLVDVLKDQIEGQISLHEALGDG